MFAKHIAMGRRAWPMLALAAGALLGLSGCGQRGPLYMPDRNARVLTHPAASAPASVPSSAPAAVN